MEALEGVLQGWAVVLLEDVATDRHLEVRPYSEDERVESSVVDGAHRYAVGDDGKPAIGVLLDVSGIEKSRMSKATERALRSVGEQHTVPEDTLVKSLLHHDLGIPADRVVLTDCREPRPPPIPHRFVHRNRELMLERFLAREPNWVAR